MVEKHDDLDFHIELESPHTAPQSLDSKQYAQHQQVQSAASPNVYPKFLEGASHPGFCILHLIFKVAAIASYVLLGLFV